jgi:hypothetical protein
MASLILMSAAVSVALAYALKQHGVDRVLGIAAIIAALCVAQLAYWWILKGPG